MLAFWAAMALWFHFQVGQTIKICVMAVTALVLVTYISVLFSSRSSSQLIGLCNVAFICFGSIFLAWWLSMKPSLTRDWAADVEVMLQKFDLNGARPNSGRSYAASASNCCLIESVFAAEKTPCCLRIM